jgi:hypothetical protein
MINLHWQISATFRRLSHVNLGPAKNQSAGRRIQSLKREMLHLATITSAQPASCAEDRDAKAAVSNDAIANTLTVNKDELLRFEH